MLNRIKQLFRPLYVPVIERISFNRELGKHPIRIMNSLKTIYYIKNRKCSISRYGDGEFRIMTDSINIGFQDNSKELANALRNVLLSKNNNLLVCIPSCIKTTRGMKKESAEFWFYYSYYNYGKISNLIYECDKPKYVFGDSMLTRPYMDWRNRLSATIKFKALKSIWRDKDVLIVEGDQTRLGVGNNLFNNAKSIKRILAPARNAFQCYERIKESVLSSYNNELVLIALGPTATVLASDLSKQGIQALDIGHIDVEYMWYLMKAKEKVEIPYKYVNEVKQNIISACNDEEYLSQILLNLNM